ncbi:MAG: TerB family tellurite resistance protein [Candidatus Cloacimonetes bacterium]|nr:TerB family tellurite resistance protein [Candidatus Cloacimonadota bacterium]
MARWQTLEGSIFHTTQEGSQEYFLKDFFENKAFIPKTDREKKEYEDFSFVSSAMALLIYVAKSDGTVDKEEKDMIMKELKFQLNQRHFEYETLAEEIGPDEMKILNHLFDHFQTEIDKKKCDLDEIIRIIDMIYQKNPYKRMFLVRLSYYVAYADKKFSEEEFDAIKKIAQKLRVSDADTNRIEQEVRKDLKIF